MSILSPSSSSRQAYRAVSGVLLATNGQSAMSLSVVHRHLTMNYVWVSPFQLICVIFLLPPPLLLLLPRAFLFKLCLFYRLSSPLATGRIHLIRAASAEAQWSIRSQPQGVLSLSLLGHEHGLCSWKIYTCLPETFMTFT